MEYFFLLFNFFNCQRRNFWLRQIKVLLLVLTLANISCANRRQFRELMQPDAMCRTKRHIDSSCGTCGIANERRRGHFIINGTPVQPPYKYPWMVAICVHEDESFCGGAIISNSFIITAAHCVVYYKHETRYVKIGFLTKTRKLARLAPISAIYIHPKFDHRVEGPFDIALIRLKKKITCNKYKSPICLPPDNVILPRSTRLTLAGWGANEVPKSAPEKYPQWLLQGTFHVDKCEKCAKMVPKKYCRRGFVYCMTAARNHAACMGDDGSPLFLRKRGKHYIQGIVPGRGKTCEEGESIPFVSVSTSRRWIRKITGI